MTFAYVYTSTEFVGSVQESHRGLIFELLVKKATTTETVTEAEKMTKRKLESY